MNTSPASSAQSLATSRIVPWETPFGAALHPAIWPLTSLEPGIELTLVVYPDGHGRHPAYVVRFESAPVIELSHDMTSSPIPGWEEAGGFNIRSSSLKWMNSPLLARHGRVGSVAIMEDHDKLVQHYVLAGADWIVHVLSTREPTITKHDRPFFLSAPIDA